MNPYAPTVDSFGQMADSVKYLLNDLPEEERLKARQIAMDKLSMGLQQAQLAAAHTSNASNMIKLQEAQRQAADQSSLRDALQNAQPTAITKLGGPNVTSPDATSLLAQGIAPKYGQGIDYSQPVDPALSDLEQATKPTPQPDASQFASEKLPPASNTVQSYNDGNVKTTVQPPNIMKIALEHAQQTGNYDLIQKMQKDIQEHAANLTALSGNANDAVQFVNQTTGSNLKTQKVGKYEFIKDGEGNTHSVFMPDMASAYIAAGTDPAEAVKKASIQLYGDTEGQKLASFMSSTPNASYQDVVKFIGDNHLSVTSKSVTSLLEILRKDSAMPAPHTKHFADGSAQDMRWNPKTQQDEPYGEKYKPTSQQRIEIAQSKMNINQLDADEQAAINRMVADKRLDPMKVTSRNQKMLAQLEIANPGIDVNAISAQLGIARNKDVIMKAGKAEYIPDLIKKTVEAGKALNYSDAQFAGIVQKWKDGQINNPKLTKYMTMRNDQLLTIGGVMRDNGMTDMAQKLEEEAMHPTLSPKALDAWAEGQLESIDPRLNFYRSLTKGNAAIPRSSYQTGTGNAGINSGNMAPGAGKAAGLPAGAVTGTFKGQKAYHIGEIVYDMSGKRLN